MRISFDLDDTLVCYDPAVPCERRRVPLLLRPWFREPLRRGTAQLLRDLRRQGHQVWIYTTSARSHRYLRWFFRFHGVTLDGIVNQSDYDRAFPPASHPNRPSKNPRAFQIDLHVDDSRGVQIEGDRHGFNVLVIDPGDTEWADRVLTAVGART